MKYLLLLAFVLGAGVAQANGCRDKVMAAEALIKPDDKTVDDEALFVDLSLQALNSCVQKSQEAKENCDSESNQMSDMYRAYCYLNAARAACAH